MHSKAQSARLAQAARRSIPLRGAAARQAAQRHRANRKPQRQILAAQAAAVARWGSGVQHAPDRMTAER